MYIRFSTLCFLLLLGSSCKNSLNKYGELYAELMNSSKGLFRGMQIGDSPEKVIEEESGSLIKQSSESLTYEVILGGSDKCSITYGFENNSLYEILAEAGFEKTDDGMKLIKGFRDSFTEKYGPPKLERGKIVWKIPGNMPESGIVLEMTDEDEYLELGYWALSIYRPSDAFIRYENETILNDAD